VTGNQVMRQTRFQGISRDKGGVLSLVPRPWSLVAVLIVACQPSSFGQQSTTDRLIQSLQARAAIYKDYKSYDSLGAAYIQKGRETGDATYYELARRALEESLDLLSHDPAAASAKTHLAVISMAEHRFEDALAWAQDALALGSGNLAPWAIVGDAYTDMGDYDRASAAYAKLRDSVSPDQALTGLAYEYESRLSYLRFLFGDSQAAVELMRNAIRTASTLHLLAENIAWSYYQLGEELFKMGDLANAEKAYQEGLGAYPDFHRDLVGLAEVRAAQERYPEAIELYKKAIAVVPYPAYAANLADVYIKAGRTAEAKKQIDLIEFIGNLNPINRRVFYRELALFYADHDMKLKESMDLAYKEMDVRHDIYTWDILAWVLYKNGRDKEAADATSRALRLGTRDALLLFHAGMIYDRLGDIAKAKDYLRRALTSNPHFHVLYADTAHKKLEDLEVRNWGEGTKQWAENSRRN